jgi:hypothetical protein
VLIKTCCLLSSSMQRSCTLLLKATLSLTRPYKDKSEIIESPIYIVLAELEIQKVNELLLVYLRWNCSV